MDQPKFNNTKAVCVTDEEAQARIAEMKAIENRHIWTLRHEYRAFLDKLYVGATIKAKLAYNIQVTSTANPTYITRPAVFHVVKKYPHVMLVSAYAGAYKVYCYVNIKDLWVDGPELVVVPTRWEAVC